MKFIQFSTLALLVLSFAAPVMAAGEKGREYRFFLEQISEINRFQVTQRPEHERGTVLLDRTIEDSTNRVVGEIDDIVLSPNGSITALSTKFDRLRLNAPVFVNYREFRVQPVSSGYRMSTMTDDRIEELYPELLASIETAAGDADSDFGVKSLIGSTIESTDGRRLGKVEDVLFRSLGSRADLLYVSMSYGTLRGRELAVPFEVVEYKTAGGRTVAIVDEDQADAMIDYAKRN